jgi:phosphatidylglycerophosphate synthase
MTGDSWTHRIARVLVRPLVGGPVTPNHLTTLRLLTGLAACTAFAAGTRDYEIWGGGLWVLSAFLDRADGELARLANAQSEWGHRYDYASDVAVTALFFIAVGFGLRHGGLGPWAVLLGLVAGLSVALASTLSEALEQRAGTGEKAYEGAGGFDFDDILYLFGPLAWLSLLPPLLVGAAVGGPFFAVWTWLRLRRA